MKAIDLYYKHKNYLPNQDRGDDDDVVHGNSDENPGEPIDKGSGCVYL